MQDQQKENNPKNTIVDGEKSNATEDDSDKTNENKRKREAFPVKPKDSSEKDSSWSLQEEIAKDVIGDVVSRVLNHAKP